MQHDTILQFPFDKQWGPRFQDGQHGGGTGGVGFQVGIGRDQTVPHPNFSVGKVAVASIVKQLQGLVVKMLGNDAGLFLPFNQASGHVIDFHGNEPIGLVCKLLIMPLDINLVTAGHEESATLLHEIPQESDLLGIQSLNVRKDGDLGLLE